MSASLTYGGWASESAVRTGSSYGLRGSMLHASTATANASSKFALWRGFLAVGAGALATIGASASTGAGPVIDRSPRVIKISDYRAPKYEVLDITVARTPSEDLARIRAIIKPAISDLASALHVSRQSVYNWINGEAVADENATRLRDLAEAADLLAHEKIVVNAALLKRKFAGGKSLLQVVKTGESARVAASQFIQIHKRESEQRQRLNAQLKRKVGAPPSSDFDLPAANDHA